MAAEASADAVGAIVSDAHALAQRVIKLAEARGRRDVAEFVRSVYARQRRADATVVIAGETNRGKSSFVNALLGADVSPVNADVATNVFLVFRHADEPVAWLRLADGSPPQRVPVESAAEWGTVAGNPDNAKNVRAIEFGLPSPILTRGLTMVDTPGTGGLVAAHRQVTLAALRDADALIFLMDTDAPLSVPEYRFLCEATQRIDTVIFVLTKVDASLAWEEIAREDRRLIARHAPDYADAPLLPVSSVDKRDADVSGDQVLLASSGFDAVERVLEERVIARKETLRAANLVRALKTGMRTLEREDRSAQAMPIEDVPLKRARAAAYEQVTEYRHLTDAWAAKLSLDYQRHVRHNLDVTQRRSLQRVAAECEAEIRAGRTKTEAVWDDLETQLRAVAMELQVMLNEAIEKVAATVSASYKLPPDELLAVTAHETPTLLDLPELPAVDRTSGSGMQRTLTAASAIGFGALSGSKWALLLGPQAALIGAGVGGLLGGVTWRAASRGQRRAQDQHEALTLVRSAVEGARIEIDAHLRDRVLELQGLLQDELKHLIEQRRRELEADVRQLDRRIAASVDQRRADHEAASTRLRETAPLRESVAALERRLADC